MPLQNKAKARSLHASKCAQEERKKYQKGVEDEGWILVQRGGEEKAEKEQAELRVKSSMGERDSGGRKTVEARVWENQFAILDSIGESSLESGMGKENTMKEVIDLGFAEAGQEEEEEIIELSDVEDDIILKMQPEDGWKEAERRLHGYSRTNKGKSPSSRSYYKKKRAVEGEEAKRIQEEYGSIKRFFKSSFDLPLAGTDKRSWSGEEFRVPDFGIELEAAGVEKERLELVTWSKKQKPSGARKLRVDRLLQLLNLEMRRGRSEWVADSITIAATMGRGRKWAKALPKWHRDWFEFRIPPPEEHQGKHSKVQTLFEDEGIKLAIREYLNRSMSKATVRGVCEVVNNYVQSERAVDIMQISALLEQPTTASNSIGLRTAQRWLGKMGLVYGRDKKGYVDGHEWEDVVAYRQNVFLPAWQRIVKTLREYDDGGEIQKDQLPWGTKRRILVTHDESAFNANDDNQYSWKVKGTEWLKPKGKGKGLMVSEFLTKAQGRLHYFDKVSGTKIEAYELLKYGKNDEGWWDSEKMLNQDSSGSYRSEDSGEMDFESNAILGKRKRKTTLWKHQKNLNFENLTSARKVKVAVLYELWKARPTS
ncbi:hypothetical protein HOY82DRAFT_600340 [Tuber indicum]|nr:hypothetical protein HOY82DRAFT_600340 [Tuber indicum]